MEYFRQQHATPQIIHNNKIEYAPHLHRDLEIIVLYSGSATANVNGDSYSLNQGDILIVFPNIIHSYSCNGKVEVAKFIFEAGEINEYNDMLNQTLPKSPVIKNSNHSLLPLTKEIIENYENSSFGVKKAYLSLLLGKILEKCDLMNSNLGENATEAAVLKFCKENFLDDITIKSVADKLHLSKSHISHIFSNKLKINFRSYLNTLRIDYSKSLILKDDLPITQIALTCGFSNLRTFNRAFLKVTGKTPTEYKRQQNRG